MNETSIVANVSAVQNGTEFVGKIYLNLPLNSSTKLMLLCLLVVIAIVAFGGNILIILYVKTKERTSAFLRACSFQSNFNFYIKSLAISDVLCSVISIPFFLTRVFLHSNVYVLENEHWGCKVSGYLLYLFPFITINNLLVISFGKYFSTRQIPRTLSRSTLKKVVTVAWVAGFIVAVFPAATLEEVRYNIDDAHYTEVCRYNNQYLPFRVTFISVVFLQYILPSCILIVVNILLIITVWKRAKRTINITVNNNVSSMAKAARIRCIYIVVALTFAFVTPYFFYFAFVACNMVTQPKISYETDLVIRTVTATVAFSNSAVNVVIYLVQIKDFRTFLKEKFFSRFVNGNQTNQVKVDAIEMEPQGNP